MVRTHSPPINPNVKRKIYKLSKIIRKKYLALKLGKSEQDDALNTILRPITSPLHEIVNQKSIINNNSFSPTNKKNINEVFNNQKIKFEKREDETEKLSSSSSIPSFTSSQMNKEQMKPVSTIPDYLIGEIDTTSNSLNYENVFDTSNDNSRLNPADISSYSQQVADLYLEQFPELAREYVEGFLRDNKKDYDTTYGVNHDAILDKWMIGGKEIKFNKNKDEFMVGKTKFQGTRGLYELIFKDQPSQFTLEDEKNYRDILNLTNVHKTNFSGEGRLRGTRMLKYRKIIKPLINSGRSYSFSGSGIYKDDKLEYNTKPIEYIYWDDVNELVDRLRLLIASKEAGNTSHNNEIASIINELKEIGVIS